VAAQSKEEGWGRGGKTVSSSTRVRQEKGPDLFWGGEGKERRTSYLIEEKKEKKGVIAFRKKEKILGDAEG